MDRKMGKNTSNCQEDESDARFLQLIVAIRSLCSSLNVVQGNISTVVVKEGQILTWGYVRSLLATAKAAGGRSGKQCTDLHAEADAITCAALNGITLDGASLYCSSIPCPNCFALIVGSGIRRIIHPPPPTSEFYSSDFEHRKRIAALYDIEICDDVELPPYTPLPVLPADIVAAADGDEDAFGSLFEDLCSKMALPLLPRKMRGFSCSLHEALS